MRSALIGYTGFVGSNILGSRCFDDLYNSSNVQEIVGKEYDLVVTAGNRADSHRINNDQGADLAEVEGLISRLRSASIKKLVLISTVCVYPAGGAPDEDTPLSPEGLTPYGQNRLFQERALSESFDTLAVRLPQLYGNGLKKGVVYDLANDYRVEFIRPDAEFQYYDVRKLWNDIEIALSLGLPSLNVATPPLTNAEVALNVFQRDISSQIPPGPESPFAQMYTRNMTTKYANHFGGSDGYFTTRDESLASLSAFVAEILSKPETQQKAR